MTSSGGVPDLVAFVLFDVDPKVRAAQRPLHTFLVSLALRDCSEPVAETELLARVCDLLPTKTGLTADDVRTAVRLHEKHGLVERTENGLRLTELRVRQLQVAEDAFQAERAAFHSEMLAAVSAASLVESERDTLIEMLESALQEMLHAQSSTVAAAWTSGGGFDQAFDGLNSREYLVEIAKRLQPGGAEANKLRRDVLAAGLQKGIQSLGAEALRYLAAVYQRTIAFALLEQDPRVLRVRADLVGTRTIYLDANVVMAAMFTADPHHALAKQVLEASHLLGVTLKTTTTTVEEIAAKTRDANAFMRRFKGNRRFHGIVDDVIVRSFHRASRDNENLKWVGWIAGFQPSAAWLGEQGIEVEQSVDVEVAEQDPRFAEVRSAVARHKPTAGLPVVVTDALNLLHVATLRETMTPDAMGSRVWHVTFDASLRRAERDLNKKGVIGGALSHDAQEWADLLAPCLALDTAELSHYVAHLAQSHFGLLAEDPIFLEKGFLLTVSRSRFVISDVMGAGPERAHQMLAALQLDEEVMALVGQSDPNSAEWLAAFDNAIEAALARIQQDADTAAALDAERLKRAEAEELAATERRAKNQALRDAAETRTVAAATEEALAAELKAKETELALAQTELKVARRRWWHRFLGIR